MSHVSCRVSIPIGFSGSLQLQSLTRHISEMNGFNPYRVFWFAATLKSLIVAETRNYEFQSLSGFLVRCNDSVLANRLKAV